MHRPTGRGGSVWNFFRRGAHHWVREKKTLSVSIWQVHFDAQPNNFANILLGLRTFSTLSYVPICFRFNTNTGNSIFLCDFTSMLTQKMFMCLRVFSNFKVQTQAISNLYCWIHIGTLEQTICTFSADQYHLYSNSSHFTLSPFVRWWWWFGLHRKEDYYLRVPVCLSAPPPTLPIAFRCTTVRVPLVCLLNSNIHSYGQHNSRCRCVCCIFPRQLLCPENIMNARTQKGIKMKAYTVLSPLFSSFFFSLSKILNVQIGLSSSSLSS